MTASYHSFLSPDEQAAAGVSAPAPLAMANRVNHDECDALNHVNNTSYMIWFERLRIHFMEYYEIGTIGDPDSPRIVIRSGHIHWIEEMLRGEDYVVTTRCTGLRRTSMTLEQIVWSGGRQRARFECVMVLLSQDGTQKVPVSPAARSRLIADGATEEPPAT